MYTFKNVKMFFNTILEAMDYREDHFDEIPEDKWEDYTVAEYVEDKPWILTLGGWNWEKVIGRFATEDEIKNYIKNNPFETPDEEEEGYSYERLHW